MRSDDVAKKHNITDATVLAVIRRKGLLSKRDRVRQLPEKEVISLYQAKVSAPEIADRYGVNYNSVYRLLARNNISVSKTLLVKKVSYRLLHKRIFEIQHSDTCSKCGKTGLSGRKIHNANLSGNYLHDVKDFAPMCVKCHKAFDKEKRKAKTD